MRKLISLVSTGLFVVLAAGGAFAQAGLRDMPLGKWWTKKPIIRELRLSLQQQTRIENLWTQRAQTLMGQQVELQKRQQVLSELLARDVIDVPVTLRVFDEVQQIKHSLERNTFLMRIMIKNLLSPEQQKKVEEIAERQRRLNEKTGEVPEVPLVKKSGH